MSAVDSRITTLLSEHFGFPPLALIDDVINAVNDIMYKCTQAIETYLRERQRKGEDEAEYPSQEIEKGTGKLETLLETQVDKNFDKFELYTLRNIFTIPRDLVEEGRIRLKHHEGIQFGPENSQKKKDTDAEISKLIEKIRFELHLRKILKLQVMKGKKINTALQQFKKSILFLSSLGDGTDQLPEEIKASINSLSPVEETLYFLLKQVEELSSSTQVIYSKLSTSKEEDGLKDVKFLPSLREKYVDGKSLKILDSLGVSNKRDDQSRHSDLLHTASISDIDNVKKINQSLNIFSDQNSSESSPSPETIQESTDSPLGLQ